MRADLARGPLTEAHDRLLDIISEHLVAEFLAEVEATPIDDDETSRERKVCFFKAKGSADSLSQAEQRTT